MSEYFSHDYNARNDLNMKKLFMGEGLSGIGLYWCLVEMLYEKNGYIDLEYIPIIAFDLRTTEEIVNNVIDKYNLFCKNDTHFFSNSVLKRLDMRNEKSEKAKKSANARWNNTNAMRTYTESNAIKEKERKEKKIKGKEKESKEPTLHFNSFEDVTQAVVVKENSIKESITKTPFLHFIEKYHINCDNYNGIFAEMDFDLLDKAFSESRWLQENVVCLSKVCSMYKRIVGGAFKDFTKPKEEKPNDIDFLIAKGFSKEWVMALTEEERAEKRKKWES